MQNQVTNILRNRGYNAAQAYLSQVLADAMQTLAAIPVGSEPIKDESKAQKYVRLTAEQRQDVKRSILIAIGKCKAGNRAQILEHIRNPFVLSRWNSLMAELNEGGYIRKRGNSSKTVYILKKAGERFVGNP